MNSLNRVENRKISGSVKKFDKISILIEISLKKVAGVQVWENKHNNCVIVAVATIGHVLAKILICLPPNSNSRSISLLKNYSK